MSTDGPAADGADPPVMHSELRLPRPLRQEETREVSRQKDRYDFEGVENMGRWLRRVAQSSGWERARTGRPQWCSAT